MIANDILWIALGGFCMILGFIGCVVPILPGPPIAFAGMLLQQLRNPHPFSTKLLVIFGVVTVVVTVLDYIVPVWGTKKFGGTKAGMWGSTIGVFAGIFCLPPIGIIIGPFLGAVIGELLVGKDMKVALKSGLGSFIGFITGVFMKVLVTLAMLIYFLIAIF